VKVFKSYETASRDGKNEQFFKEETMPDKSDLPQILKDAIKVESDGYHFYKMAADQTIDPKGREMLESLASDEKKHMKALKEQYKLYKEQGRFDWEEGKLKMKIPFDPSSSSPIFSREFRNKVNESHFEMAALSVGIMLEQNSIDFYNKSAQRAEDPQAKTLFSFLANWEGQHLRALISQYNYLKEEYWTDARFFPSI
jgi:rubrerythrin